MKKMPTIFLRDYSTQPPRVVDQINPECEWVFNNEGVATIKLDGTCCMIRENKLYKRREVKAGKEFPQGYTRVDEDIVGNSFGWVPVGDGPEDKYHREAFDKDVAWLDGTYELVGKNIQGNPYNMDENILMRHGRALCFPKKPLTFKGLLSYLKERNMEGIVWHSPSGKMAKIKCRDFGLNWLGGK